jgi:alcohol dehydrogenase
MQDEYIGPGSIKQLTTKLDELGSTSVFLVTGKKSFGELDQKFALRSMLGNRRVSHFNDFEVNPKIKDIEKGIEFFVKGAPDVVIAIGGGSAIDVAKAINFKSGMNRPLIAVPTTSGTGSEATHFAVVYVDGTKTSIAAPSILPTIAIIDPELTYSLPKEVTRASGLDALCQAIESHWSNKSTEESKEYARKALTMILPNFEAAVSDPNTENRQALSEGAHLAGKAINISFTTASHSISYPITSRFSIPHGEAVAMTIPGMILWNSEVTENDVQDERGIEYVRNTNEELLRALGCTTAQEAAAKVKSMIQRVGGVVRIEDFSSDKEEAIEYIVANGFTPERMKNNPRDITQEELRGLLVNL